MARLNWADEKWLYVECESKEALLALKEIYESTKDPELLEDIIYAVEDHEGPEAVEILHEIAMTASYENLARDAVSALEDVMEEEDPKIFIEIYKKRYETKKEEIPTVIDL